MHPFCGIGLVICTYIDLITGKKYIQRGTGFIVAIDIIITALHTLIFKTK